MEELRERYGNDFQIRVSDLKLRERDSKLRRGYRGYEGWRRWRLWKMEVMEDGGGYREESI